MSEVIKDRRIGRITVPLDMVNENPSVARIALGGVLVLQAQIRVPYDDIEYVGICDAFDIVAHGARIPTYNAILRDEQNKGLSLARWEKSRGES